MGSSHPDYLGCTVVNTEIFPGCSVNGKTIVIFLTMVFLILKFEVKVFDKIETTILSLLQTIFDEFGWAGVFGLMVFENATGITPNEVILTFAGWMLIEKHGIAPSFILLAGLYAGLGSAVGASITYWAARLGGRPLVEKFAKIFRIDLAMLNKAEEQMHRWGAGIIMVGRVLPGFRILISIPAGIAKISFIKFFVATFIGAYVWCTVLIGAGYALGHEWKLISDYIKQHFPLVFSIGVFALITYLIYHHRAQLPALARAYTPYKQKE